VIAGWAGSLLLVSAYTDLRWHRVNNKVLLAFAVGGLALRAVRGGWEAVALGGLGMAVGLLWWVAVIWAQLGPGDAKLAMALGAILGPVGAVMLPAVGTMAAALGLVPWLLWHRFRAGLWRWHQPIPLAPWILAAFVAWGAVALRRSL